MAARAKRRSKINVALELAPTTSPTTSPLQSGPGRLSFDSPSAYVAKDSLVTPKAGAKSLGHSMDKETLQSSSPILSPT
eukprot:NODE_5225_length_420_cov_20.102426_g4549_i0.p1 GENE.NODE_5225_length_420_cov_20.102426_g4549_i0~~NODE_5225_length_420_cov_20.102426_g4549_i0.p1  ORF type:complete len:79 (-),score=8.37 NODE_5225_length_420_cov_20.102426_g4549_i0:12-248(-)